MPELPEVEITRYGLAQELAGSTASGAVVREARLRWPVPADLSARLQGQRLKRIERRGKYLLFRFETGTLIGHLGMSGSLRVVPAASPAGPHEHVDLVFGARAARLRDPRRFGALLWHAGADESHPLLADLGIEPLGDQFDGEWLFRATRGRRTPVKLFVMDSHVVVGVGNIYASESLFRAGIRPRRPAGRLTRAECTRLAQAIRDTLQDALAAGGSSLRDFIHSDGASGYFQQQHYVYDRAGQACRVCGQSIRTLRLGQRSTFWCAKCQR
ncbi:MAG: bifunctional DNA-formamidopyrimidine glycosylase/DNA-(apurinic or apyrimidinic site) lyase [Rhodocyclaceae bacterium]|nr:bifunctional DNA-formamidopyrimidine glycosylase/DNA-(apurinic or apyrimidinic site) lyase [Rhodocyclaceae bacterium]MBX3667380.1 bifunctional DNA-formamidopyrimidine glycosylase/DNA-(apurinic or apyrimidinic site) lyase [Rhodocyclaceae bacterium]